VYTGNAYITATGGTITPCGDYKIHTFTSDGTFCVSAGGGPLAVVDYLVVAGGGSGGTRGGGGGAGGFRESYCATTSGCYTASPLASATSLPSFSSSLSNYNRWWGTRIPITGPYQSGNQDQIQFFQQLHQLEVAEVEVDQMQVLQITGNPGGSVVVVNQDHLMVQ
jgi:hypothetical protein